MKFDWKNPSRGLAITVITAALSYLTRKAADMKTENDLTI